MFGHQVLGIRYRANTSVRRYLCIRFAAYHYASRIPYVFIISILVNMMDLPTKKPRILVVDDTLELRKLLTVRLSLLGYQADSAENGRRALELLRQTPYDLVLLDIMMPIMDGYATLEAMKADEALRAIPVIVVSAVSELDSVVRCIELGADDYLVKPYNNVLLQARIAASLERKRLHDQEQSHAGTCAP